MHNEIRKLLDSLESQDLDKDRDYLEQSLKARFVEDICRILKENGVSQAALARKLGKSRQYVSHILNETANFTLGTLVDIALALDCDVVLRLKKHTYSCLTGFADEELLSPNIDISEKTVVSNTSPRQLEYVAMSNVISLDRGSYIDGLPSSKNGCKLKETNLVA